MKRKSCFSSLPFSKLKLAFTSPDVISTSPKSFLLSRIDLTLLLLFRFLKEHHLPIGQVKNRFLLAQQQNPLAPCYPTLLFLHAAVSTVGTVPVYRAGGCCFKHRPDQQPWALKKHVQSCWPLVLNPLSPNIHIQILQTDLHTFP